jgi:CheY-like chemotaxis protein
MNAVDAMPAGGKLTVRTRAGRMAPIGEAGSGATHGILEIEDTGVGMSEKTKSHCLEPFYSTKGKRGTGMGLAMVYGVMERHEGRIEIESALGQGTTIRLIFPLHARVTSAAGVEMDSKPAVDLKILCIDDEPLLRELIKEMLEREGHYVEAADGGQTGLDAFQKASERGRAFDVVITDLGMPHLDGREVARALKKQSPKTPVIMLTGWGAFMQENEDMPIYVDAVLSKPPRAKELNSMLGRLIQKQAV